MHYFPHINPKAWNVVEALCIYDDKYPNYNFFSILEILKADLVQFKEAQGSLKKHINPMLESIAKLGNLNCLKQITSEDTESNQSSGAPLNFSSSSVPLNSSNSSDSRTTNSVKIKKFSGSFINGSGPVTIIYKPNTRKRLQETANSVSSNQQYDDVLTEGQKKYRIMTPDHKSDPLHRPKLRKVELEVLKGLVHFGTSSISDNITTMNQYKNYERDQHENKSLRGHGLLEHITNLLENDNTKSFVQLLWTTEIEELDDKAGALLDIIRYTLTSFHLILSDVSLLKQNNEHNMPFIENIVPSLLSLSKITGFVNFKWCETEFTANKYLSESDYKYSTTKYSDSLGCLRTSNNMEIVIIEASSGKLKENILHSMKDYLKTLERGVFSLKKEALLNKNSSIATFKKRKVFGIQVIKNQITLSELYMNDEKSWNFIEKRTATLPSSWNDRILLVQYLELVATIFNDLYEAQNVSRQLMKENMGLSSNKSPSISSMFEE